MKIPTLFARFSQKKFQKGVDKVFLWVYNAECKGKGVFECKCSKTLFYFQKSKNNSIYEEGNDVFNAVGDAPTVKGVFSFFIKEETVCRM